MWDLMSGLVEDEGFRLFDLDLPTGKRGRMMLYVTGPDGKGTGVNLDDCARISRRLSLKLDVEIEIPGSYVLEVSTPGVNRRLRRPEHFQSAVGEKVKINTDSSMGKARSVRGTVVGCDDAGVIVREGEKVLTIPYRSIKEARVDFDFRSN